jgi:hypothetical protein
MPRCWLSINIRTIISLCLTAVVCYLAVLGVGEARAALVSTFSVLAGSLFGERAALKRPGEDN